MSQTARAINDAMKLQLIAISLIDRNPNNPRKIFAPDDIARMASSLASKGMLVPLRVMPANHGRFTLISGETRLTGAEHAGWTEVPCMIVEGLDEQGVLEDQIVDNGVRRSLRPTEEADAICRLKMLTGETSKAIAERLNRNPSEITTFEAIRELPQEMRDAIDEGKVPITSGYHLAKLPDATIRGEIFRAILDGRLNRDGTIRAVAKAMNKEEKAPRKTASACITLKGEKGAAFSIEPGQSAEELYTLAGRVFRAAEAAKKAKDIKVFGSKLS